MLVAGDIFFEPEDYTLQDFVSIAAGQHIVITTEGTWASCLLAVGVVVCLGCDRGMEPCFPSAGCPALSRLPMITRALPGLPEPSENGPWQAVSSSALSSCTPPAALSMQLHLLAKVATVIAGLALLPSQTMTSCRQYAAVGGLAAAWSGAIRC